MTAYGEASEPSSNRPAVRWIARAETAVSAGVLFAMSLLALLESAASEFLGRGIPGFAGVVQHLALALTFAGAALAARSGRLLTLSTQELIPARWRRLATGFTSAVAVAIVIALLQASVRIAIIDWETGGIIAWGIPIWVAVAWMPAGYALIAGRLIFKAANSTKGRIATALLAITILAVFSHSFGSWGSVDRALVPPALAVLLLAAAAGLPIFAAMGGVALLFFWADGTPALAVAEQAYRLSKMD